MKPIKKLDELVEIVKKQPSVKLAVANGHDPHTIEATNKAAREGLVDVALVGDADKIEELSSKFNLEKSHFEIIDEKDTRKAAMIARDMVRNKEADILMKGLMPTDIYMRLILDKEKGLLPKGNILSHIAVMDAPNYPKLLFVSDVAVIPEPDLSQKVQMLNYTIDVTHKFGIDNPKAAIISATEKVTDKVPSTIDAAIITKMAERGQIRGAIVDGPLAFDIAVSKEACEIKGFKSEIQGDSDILIFPNIETGNVFFKTITKIANGYLAALVSGTTAPCILTSRADSEKSKFYSIAMAGLIGKKE